MFNLFNTKTIKESVEEAQTNYQVPPVTEETQTEVCNYTIGTTTSGRTVLKVASGSYTVTLTMNEPAVRQMIRMLEATLPNDKSELEHSGVEG